MSQDTERSTEEENELELLALLVEAYEKEKYPLPAPDPIDAIKFRMEQANLQQKDIAPLFGGKTRISEILNGKRELNLKTIYNLHHYLGIPLESLVRPKKKYKLPAKAEKALMANEAIAQYRKSSRD